MMTTINQKFGGSCVSIMLMQAEPHATPKPEACFTRKLKTRVPTIYFKAIVISRRFRFDVGE